VSEHANGNGSGPPSESQASRGPLSFGPAASRTPTVVYACSGCSDAGELADRAARSLAQLGLAEMSCLAGIGGRVKSLMKVAQRADEILVIDGCPLNCARRTLEMAGFQRFSHLELHRLGLRKGSCPPTPERVALATEAAARMIASSLPCSDRGALAAKRS
jgi:uncharacterized metal-binding protein